MIKNLLSSFALYIACLVMVGLYCIIVYIAGNSFWTEKSTGSLIIDQHQQIRGSILLAQKTNSNLYFTGRPTGKIDDNCDVALYNETLKTTLLKDFKEAGNPYDISSLVPSASLLDPYITKREALLQAPKIANARSLQLDQIIQIIQKHTLQKAPPFFELQIVNTTILNSDLDGYLDNQ